MVTILPDNIDNIDYLYVRLDAILPGNILAIFPVNCFKAYNIDNITRWNIDTILLTFIYIGKSFHHNYKLSKT